MSTATRILVALIAGLLLGIAAARLAPALGTAAADIFDPLGNLWLNGLKMTIVPLVVALLVTGIAQSAEAAASGRVAARSLVWILTLMTLSAITGAILMPLFLSIVPMPAAAAAALKTALGSAPAVAAPPPFSTIIRAIIPTNPVAAAANTDILPLLIFTGIFAFALTRMPPAPRAQLTGFFAAIADAMLIVIDWVLKLAPLGVFALAFVVGARAGAAAFGALLHYILTVSSIGIFIALLAYPLAVIGGGRRLRDYALAIAPVQALAVSTQSSIACLPLMLQKSESLGVPESSAGVTLPMAVALLRATGPAMNLAVALYVANWFDIALGPVQITTGIVVAVLTSLGAVSLPGTVSFVSSCAPICLAIGVPVEPLAILIAVETLPDIFRTLGNAMMDVSVTTVVARQTGLIGEASR